MQDTLCIIASLAGQSGHAFRNRLCQCLLSLYIGKLPIRKLGQKCIFKLLILTK